MVQSYIEPDAILYHGVKNGIDLWPWKLSHRLLNTDIWAYLRNSWVIAFICGVHRDYVSAKLQMTLWAQFDLCLTPRKAITQTKYAHMPHGTMWAQGPWAHFIYSNSSNQPVGKSLRNSPNRLVKRQIKISRALRNTWYCLLWVKINNRSQK